MGLDMYLNKKTFIGAEYKHRNVTGTIDIKVEGKPVKVDFDKVTYIVEKAGYWRKANAIHNWFVTNVQDGVDDCKEYYVDYDQLQDLKKLCEKIIETKDGSLMPPTSGFFFGSTEVDDYYFGDLMATIEILNNLDPDSEYTYQSSW